MQVKQEGYEMAHDGKCITVFSAPNYWSLNNNKNINNFTAGPISSTGKALD